MQIETASYQRGADEWGRELKLKFSLPMLIGYYKQTGKYSITPKQYRTVWTRIFLIEISSGGVNVCLHMPKSQRRLFHKDIVYGERSWLRLVQKQLAYHGRLKSYRSILMSFRDSLSALVSQDRLQADKERQQIRDASRLLESLDGKLSRRDRCRLRSVKSIF